MSYLRQVPIDEAEYPPFTAVRKEFGFIPNFFRAQTARRDLIEAELGLVETILVKEGALSRRQKEYVFLVCSASNLSTYCVTAHCEIVRMLGIKGPEPEEIAIDHPNADIPPADKALLDFARTLSLRPTSVGQRHFELAVSDLAKAELEYPGWLKRLLTHPVRGLENYRELFQHLTGAHGAIKVYCEVTAL